MKNDPLLPNGRELRAALRQYRREPDAETARRQQALHQKQQAERAAAAWAAAEALIDEHVHTALNNFFDVKHLRERRDLQDDERAMLDSADSVTFPLSWSPFPPRAALALRDKASLEYWDEQIQNLSDTELIGWLQGSHLPLLRRPPGIQDFDDLMALASLQERIANIRQSVETHRQKALRKALVPTRNGRRKKDVAADDLQPARDLRRRLTTDLQALRQESPGDVSYRAGVSSLIARVFPAWPEHKRAALLDQVGTMTVQPSQAAATIAGRKFHISADRVRRGKATPVSRRRSTPRRLIHSENLEAIEHARERTNRGQPNRSRKRPQS